MRFKTQTVAAARVGVVRTEVVVVVVVAGAMARPVVRIAGAASFRTGVVVAAAWKEPESACRIPAAAWVAAGRNPAVAFLRSLVVAMVVVAAPSFPWWAVGVAVPSFPW